METNSSQKEEIYTTLMNKIRAKLTVAETKPAKDSSKPNLRDSGKKIGLGLVDGTLRSINKGLLSRLSQQRGKNTDSVDGSLAAGLSTGSKPDSKPVATKTQQRLKVLDRDIKELNSLRTYQKKDGSQTGLAKGALSILDRLRQSPARKRTLEIPESQNSNSKLLVSTSAKPETAGDRIRQGLESLKAKVAQMPSQQAQHKPIEEDGPQARGIDINLYKRKVEKRPIERDKEASLKVMQARRGDNGSLGRKNLTQTFTEKIRASRIANSALDY